MTRIDEFEKRLKELVDEFSDLTYSEIQDSFIFVTYEAYKKDMGL